MPLRIIFMGTPEFAVPSLRALAASSHELVLAVTKPDRARGRGRHVAEPAVKVAARELGIPTFQPEDVRTPESLARLAEESADVFAVAAFGQILSQKAIEVPRLGAFNLHASLLPKYRGAAPMTYAVWNGESETGLTIFRIVREMDAGEIALQARTPIGPDETTGQVHDRMAEMGAEFFVRFLADLEAGTIEFTPQDHSQATFAPTLKKEDGEIDWTQRAGRICLHIRAMCPWPGAYTCLQTAKGPQRVTLLRASPLSEAASAEPGQIVSVVRDSFVVRSGEGQIRVERLQPAGKRAMDAAEFLRGHPLQAGDQLGTAPTAP